jgi:hypothetical protein
MFCQAINGAQMKTSRLHPTSAHATGANTLLGVAFAAALTAVTIGSAVGQENDRRNSPQYAQNERHDQQRGDQQQNRGNQRSQQEQHSRVQTRSSHQERQYGDNQRYRRANQSYGYADPAYVYAPPPVVYEPRPSPGISLFFNF